MPRKRKQSRVAALERLASGQHRTLVYCDDLARGPERWGYWCQDCPTTAMYSTQASAERMADHHKAATRRSLQDA